MSTLPLCLLKKGETAIICSILCPAKQHVPEDPLLYRLSDLGFCPDTPVTCVNLGIFHNPHAYLVRGSVIALRNQDAKRILVKRVTNPHTAKEAVYEK